MAGWPMNWQNAVISSTAFRGTIDGYKHGDADLDRDVDVTDFDFLASNFGSVGAEWEDGNFDFDADLDITDFNYLANNFAPNGYVSGTAVPEPVSSF